MPAHISDQLGPFVGLLEENSRRRLPTRGEDEVLAWRKTISHPLESLLQFLCRKGLLESQSNVDGEMYLAVQEALPCLMAIWRYVDPASNKSGFEDALRRAVNRFQRTRRSFSFGGSSLSDVGSSDASATPLARPCSLPAIPGLKMASERQPISNETLRSPSSSRHSSKETTRSASKTRQPLFVQPRCSTPGSTTSSRSTLSHLPGLTPPSSASSCSTAKDAKNSIFSAGNSWLLTQEL